jgi:hypothetical protein
MVGAILLQNAEPVLISDIEALPENRLSASSIGGRF